MSSTEQLCKSISMAFVNTLRETELGAHFKGPELLFFLDKKFPEIYREGILNLEPVYQEMRSTPDIDANTLLGFMLLFREGESALGIQMQLPSDLLLLKGEQRERLLRKVKKQVDSHRLQPAARARAQAEAAASALNTGGKAERVVLGGSRRRRNWLVGAALAVLLAGVSIGMQIYNRQPHDRQTTPVEHFDLSAVGLNGTLERKQSIFLLIVNAQEFDSIPRPLQRSRLKTLASMLREDGISTLVVMADNGESIALVAPGRVDYLPRRHPKPGSGA